MGTQSTSKGRASVTTRGLVLKLKVICLIHNLGKSAKHSGRHLLPDGTCKFRHVCDQFVSNKGPGGKCEGNHARVNCNNPAKIAEPLA